MGVKMKYFDAFKNKNGLRPDASLIHRFTMKQFTVNIIIIIIMIIIIIIIINEKKKITQNRQLFPLQKLP